ncbi:MAG TPA: outer membrane protein assembly factor BamA [Vicinamibacteria bacterium]
MSRVEIVGARGLPAGTFLYYVSTQPGDELDEVRLRSDFRRLWDAGFLDNLVLEVLDDADADAEGAGKLVRFHVQERARVRIVDYRGSKVLTPTKIEERLNREEAALRAESFFDPKRSRKVENIIPRMLQEEGHLFGVVKREEKSLPGACMQLSFVIEDGLRARVKSIGFQGNDAFGDGALRRRMKLKERGFWNLSWLTGGDVYTPDKWREDQKRLGDFYLDRGHVQASVGEPTLSFEEGVSGTFRKRPVKWLKMEVPLAEGDPFRVGNVALEGFTLFKPEQVSPLFDLETGDLYRDSKIRKGQERLRDLYGRHGYVQATLRAERQPDPARQVVDLKLAMDEDKRYYVGRIQFSGNDTTRDAVIRRQLFLNEADVFNTEALRQSVRRLNQLGYFKPLEGPRLAQSESREDMLDLTFAVEEQNRNQFSVQASHSAETGPVFGVTFMTQNLFGRGQTVQLEAERGDRYHNYQLSAADPFFRGRPLSLAFTARKSWQDVEALASQGRPGYTQDESLARVGAGYPLGRFTRLEADYAFSVADVRSEGPVDPRVVDGLSRESRVSLGLVYDTVDHPLQPRRGVRLSGSVGLVGGPLGGTVSYLEPRLRLSGWVPHTRRTAFGLRAEAGWLRAFGDTAPVDPATGRNGLPFQRRYTLGGETQLRGYRYESVGPTDSAGYLIGGEKYLLGSAEYAADLGGPFRLLTFVDAGQAFRQGERYDLGSLRVSTGVELRFMMPVLNVPLRLIQSWNLNRGTYPKDREFRFVFGAGF